MKCLCIGPLGWSKVVWNKLLNKLPEFDYDFIEYMEHKIENINEQYLKKELVEKVNVLGENDILIASSFGSRLLLYYLNECSICCKHMILVEGFEEIPKQELLKEQISYRQERFDTVQGYLEMMLGSAEREDKEIVDAVLDTVIEDNQDVFVRCDNETMIAYLSLLSEVTTKELIQNLKQQSCGYTLYSSQKIEEVPYISIKQEEHLLMLSTPEKLVEVIENIK